MILFLNIGNLKKFSNKSKYYKNSFKKDFMANILSSEFRVFTNKTSLMTTK
jgi:hypothetical protein